MRLGEKTLAKSRIGTYLLVIGALLVCIQQADATISTAWSDPNTITFTITGEVPYDDCEIMIDSDDVAGNFESFTAGWSVQGVRTASPTQKYLILKRAGDPSSADSTVVVKDKNNKLGRGKSGQITLTKGGNVIRAKTGQPTFRTIAFIEDTPTLSQWGLIILAVLLLMAGAVVIVRRRCVTA